MGHLLPTDNLFLWTVTWLIILFCLLCALIIAQYVKILNRNKEIFSLKNKLVSAQYTIEELTKEKVEKQNFADSLTNAEVTTKLQEPRLQIKNQGIPETPEKYRYLASMARGGMSKKDISEILNISLDEADQLITLAQIAK